MQDVRYALRMMRRSPGFTAVAIVSLALGIGANTAIFSLINTLMLRPLPIRDPGQLVEVLSQYPDPGEPANNGYAWKYFERFRDQNHVFSDVIGVSPSRYHLTASGVEGDAVDGEYVTGNFFSGLGVTPAIGRLIGPADDRLGSPDAAVAVLSWASWHTRFHQDPAVVGMRVSVNGAQATVIGVAARPFFGLQVGAAPELWLPVAMEPLVQHPSQRESGQLGTGLMARLKPGASIDQARAELRVLDRPRIEEIARRGDMKWLQVTIDVVPAAAGFSTLSRIYARPLFALLAIVGVLLLLACTNVASLLLARGAARQREMAVRVSLGASRLRLARQSLTESMLLSGAGCAIGVALAYLGAGALMRIVASGRVIGMPAHIEIQPQLDLRVLLFTAGTALLSGALFGLAPAWSACVSAPVSSLRATGAAAETPSRRLVAKSLVVAQVALSVVLVSAAGLFASHVSRLRNLGLGFQRESVLLVTLDPSGSGYEGTQLATPYRMLLARLSSIPGVRSATLSAVTPIEGAGASRYVVVPGFQERPEDRRRVALNWAAPKYFETLGTPLLAGRDFSFEDAGRGRVAIVSESMARYFFGDRSPIGQLFTFEGEQDRPYEIIGVAGDSKYLNLHEPIRRMAYRNVFQEPRVFSHQFSLRTSVAVSAVAGEARRAVREVLKTVSIASVRTLNDQVDASIIPERLVATLSEFFGGLGALLAAIGLYGLLAYTVTRRTSEIGIRMALGATEGNVVRMVQKSALSLVCAGLTIGVPLAFVAARFAVTFADNTSAPTIPIASGAAAMLAVAVLAAHIPARRAARIDPIDALRQD